MKAIIQDILKHTMSIGIFEHIKIEGKDGVTRLDGLDSREKKHVILNAIANEHVPEFDGTFAFTDLVYLKALTEYFLSSDKEAELTITEEQINEKMEKTSLVFCAEDGTNATYRFAHGSTYKDMKRLALDVVSEISIHPDKNKVNEFSRLTAMKKESSFGITTEDGKLIFTIGDGRGHALNFVFAENMTDLADVPKIKKMWSVEDVVPVLKLAASYENSSMKISSKGLITVEFDSGPIKYFIYVLGGE